VGVKVQMGLKAQGNLWWWRNIYEVQGWI